jgi:hypothetical protein
VTTLGSSTGFTLNGSAISTYFPSKLIYAATGSDSKVHIYGVDLSNSAVTPTALQVGSLALTSLASICDYGSAQTSQVDPASLFVVLHVAGATGCGMSDDTYQVVHYADAPTAAPTVAHISTTSFNPLYNASGALAGLMLLDSPGQQVLFYPDATFTNSRTLASGATNMQLLYDRSGSSSLAFVDGVMFFSVTQNSFDAIYRLDVNGNVILVVRGLFGVDAGAVADDSSLFFIDTKNGTTSTLNMYQMDLGGSGGALPLYTATADSATTYRLIGSNGSVLVFYSTTRGTSTSSTIMSVPKGTQTPTASTLAAAIDGSMWAFMDAPSFDDPPNEKIFVNVTKTSTAGSSSTVVRTSEVLSPSGTVLEAPLANSLYLYRISALADSVGQIKGITDTDGNYGGSSVYSVKISDFTASVFNSTAGTPFVVPTSQVLGLAAIASTGGEAVVQSASAHATAAAFDTSKLLIVPISIANTDITFE